MHVFVTGATGWVGSAVVADLLGAGHRVSGLARSEPKAAVLASAGAAPVRASLDDAEALRQAVADADAVIHTAFDHDFSRFAASAAEDERTIALLGDALAGSDRPLLVTSGLSRLAAGRPATEADVPDPAAPRRSEPAARALAERGLRVATIRLAPTVHGVGEHGFLSILAGIARRQGVSAWPGAGNNRWAAVHRSDAARLYRLALEDGLSEPVYHAVAESLPMRTIAEAIGTALGLPCRSEPVEHFGWFGAFAAAGMDASAELTRSRTGWEPTGPALLADLAAPGYFSG